MFVHLLGGFGARQYRQGQPSGTHGEQLVRVAPGDLLAIRTSLAVAITILGQATLHLKKASCRADTLETQRGRSINLAGIGFSGRTKSNSSDAQLGRHRSDFGPQLLDVGQIWPKSERLGQTRAKFGRTRRLLGDGKRCRARPKFCSFRAPLSLCDAPPLVDPRLRLDTRTSLCSSGQSSTCTFRRWRSSWSSSLAPPWTPTSLRILCLRPMRIGTPSSWASAAPCSTCIATTHPSSTATSSPRMCWRPRSLARIVSRSRVIGVSRQSRSAKPVCPAIGRTGTGPKTGFFAKLHFGSTGQNPTLAGHCRARALNDSRSRLRAGDLAPHQRAGPPQTDPGLRMGRSWRTPLRHMSCQLRLRNRSRCSGWPSISWRDLGVSCCPKQRSRLDLGGGQPRRRSDGASRPPVRQMGVLGAGVDAMYGESRANARCMPDADRSELLGSSGVVLKRHISA